MKERIVVAMSGGVDSSVAAALLQKEGYDVIGVNMRIWNHLPMGSSAFGSCCSPEDVADARRVADRLNIPFYVLNMEKEFKCEVVDYFVSSYLNGLTPNPCIQCNKILKFDYLMNRVKTFGASKVATGHYASIVLTDHDYPVLKRGVDKAKDQSYFLFNLKREQLRHILMPLGGYTKPDIRRLAKSMGLSVAEKRDSQEICFIPDKNYAGFIRDRISEDQAKEGDIINSEGKILGRHKGIIFYTIGQRKGLGIGSAYPLYVLLIDKENNQIVVGEKKELERRECAVEGINWLIDCPAGTKIKADVQIRYRHTPGEATIHLLSKDRVTVVFEEGQSAITPGQAAVFYRDDVLIGGGWITR